MKYKINKLDGRFAYREHFQFYLGFSSSMARQHGPVDFNNAMTWLIERYGWSAEVRQWHHIHQWTKPHGMGLPIASGLLVEASTHCNPNWSWSNAYSDLRVYLATEQELVFFQLAHPVDQKMQ